MQGVRQSYTVLRNVRLNIGAKHTSTSVKDVDKYISLELLVGGGGETQRIPSDS